VVSGAGDVRLPPRRRKGVRLMKPGTLITLIALSLGGIIAGATTSNTSVTAIRNVRVFDGKKVLPVATVLFSKGVITAAGPSVKVPEGATVVDGTGKTLLPGL